ncbi:Lumican [Acipenser ruthenus]|uniref:Lumican n=1 Tax=Acipenser ruthenus TaxID=7906 RepID=A0A444UWW4_ACIRT|nr:Lumican [Acipenser ruthenus]
MEQWIVLLCLALAGAGQCLGSFSDYDYGGMPVMINRLVGEPSVLSLRGRVDANWYRVMNSESCPLECDCPIQWPSAMYCDSRGLTAQGVTPSAEPFHQLQQPDRYPRAPARWPEANLFINYNNLTDIPGPLPDGLKQLRLAHNKIGKISPNAFENLKNLTLLLLHGNQLKTIGEADFKGLQSIILLDLSHNKLIEFPKNLPPSIQQLYVSNNSLASLPQDCLMGFDRLQYLRISHNKLVNQGLPADVFNVPSIVELDLSYNQLSSIPPVHQALQYLYLEANHIQGTDA